MLARGPLEPQEGVSMTFFEWQGIWRKIFKEPNNNSSNNRDPHSNQLLNLKLLRSSNLNRSQDLRLIMLE